MRRQLASCSPMGLLSIAPFLTIASGMVSLVSGSLAQQVSDAGFWMLGCGAMGGALLTRWLEEGLDPAQVTIIDPSPAGLPSGFTGRTVSNMAEAMLSGETPRVLVLAIKPQNLAEVAPQLEAFSGAMPLVISMLAGVRTTTLTHLLQDAPIARIMPNTPALIGKGTTAIFGVRLKTGHEQLVQTLLEAAGSVIWLDEESQFDAVTAISGCGPAFLFRFIEALAGAGEALGLDPETAAKLALDTVTGSATLAETSPYSPTVLRQQVTSPSGVTEAGLDVLDGNEGLSQLMRATLRAAAERSRALANATDSSVERSQ